MSTLVEDRIDYASVVQSPAFQELVARRRRFVSTALTIAVAWFGTFVLLTAYAHGFMSTILVPGLSVAYVLGLSQFVLVWVLTAAYLRASTRTFEPLQARVVAAARTRAETPR
jgi:uncharacterized membrane protein (DUF485 family)